MMREIGYIKLHRKLVKWRWYTNQVMKSVFLHLLLTANFTKNYYNGVEVRPGQVVTGRRALAEATGLTENQVRTAITKLKDTGEITVKSMGNFSVVTLVNWAKYQAETPVEALVENEAEAEAESPTVHQDTTTQSPHYKKEEKVKKVKEGYTGAYTREGKGYTPKKQPSVFDSGDYDYDAIRKKARERIRRIAEQYSMNQSA